MRSHRKQIDLILRHVYIAVSRALRRVDKQKQLVFLGQEPVLGDRLYRPRDIAHMARYHHVSIGSYRARDLLGRYVSSHERGERCEIRYPELPEPHERSEYAVVFEHRRNYMPAAPRAPEYRGVERVRAIERKHYSVRRSTEHFSGDLPSFFHEHARFYGE